MTAGGRPGGCRTQEAHSGPGAKFRTVFAFRILIALVCMAWLAGCALSGNPQPPTLWLPVPVKDLTAMRTGNQVHLQWTMPRLTTDKVLLKGDQKARFCWKWLQSSGAANPTAHCTDMGNDMFAPGKQAGVSLPLPAELTSGPPHAAAFLVELENHAGKTAGPSNPALIATGAPPPSVTGFGAVPQPEGVLLHWNKAAPQPGLVLRLHRDPVKLPGAAKPNEDLSVAPSEQETLEVNLDQQDPGEALDRTATLDHPWRYRAERVLKVDADGHALEVAGEPSSVVTVDAKDVFPPQVPGGLAAIPDTRTHAIDLSWLPNAEPDLAGYFVYRRDATAGGPDERISGAGPLAAPSFSDTTVVPGHQYAYSVSAVDRDGNESARSEEVEEQLPQ